MLPFQLEHLPAHPAFAPYRALLDQLDAGAPALAALNRVARSLPSPPTSALGAPVRFVSASHQASALAYEQRILERGEVATREGDWHDFFNALAWMAYPRTKAALNASHCVDGVAAAGTRSRCRDALTLLDESGIVVRCTDANLIGLWREHQWRALFWDQRDAVARSFEVAVIGHGLLVKLLQPFRSITGRALLLTRAPDRADDSRATLDTDAAAAIAAAGTALTPEVLLPLPVAALPGWDTERLGAELFDDAAVFRPRT